MVDPYLYENSDVLKNKLSIKDGTALSDAEADITSAKMMTVDEIKGDFDYAHYKKLHKHIFEDIYDWAGEEREIPISKSEKALGGISVQYAYPNEIGKNAKKAIKKLHDTDWNSLSPDERAEKYAKNIAELWQAHPFREGNTRTTMTFACQFADTHGFPMDRQLFASYSGYTRTALVMSSIGQYSETEHLTKIFKDSMERGARQCEMTEKTKTAEAKAIKLSRYDMAVSDNFAPKSPDISSPDIADSYNK